jgi:hypothetical protein
MHSQSYHNTHLAFARLEIVEAAAMRQPISEMLLTFEDDVRAAERDRLAEEPDEQR